MAEEEKEKSANQILQALDALSQTLHKARATRRTTSLPLPRSPKDADDVVVDAAEDEAARPQPRRRSSPMSPLRSKPKLHKREYDDSDEEEEEGADDESAPPKSRQQQEFTAVKPEDVMVDGAAEKKGVTSWGATRVLSHIGMRRFGCVFSVEVVSAQGAPPSMNGLRLAVNVRRKEKRDGDGADFDEALYVRCSLYGAGAGAAGTNKPLSSFVEPARQPFLLSVAVDGPELDSGRCRSAVSDLSQFAMEVTDKGQQWDMVFPLATAGKANKGGDLFVKLVFQSADVDGTYSQLAGEGKTIASSALSSFARKLRKSSLSNMLTPKMTRVKTPKLDVPAPDLQGIDSFMLDEPVPVAAEVKEKQQEEPEPEATPVVEVKEEPREEKSEREPADEPGPAAEVKEEEQKEPEPDAQDDASELPVFDVIVDESVEGQEEKEELMEEADEETKEESDEVANEEATPSDVSDEVADAVEPVDAEAAGSEEASVVDGDDVAKEVANELEMEVLEEATPSDVSDAVADAVEPVEAEAAGSDEVSVVAGDEVSNDIETEVLEEATPSDVSDAVTDAAEPMEAEAAGSEEVSVVAGDEVANELETEAVEVATTPSDVSDTVADAVEVEPVDSGAAQSEEASVVAGDELAKEVDNELDTEPVESATPSCDDVSDAVAKEVEPVDAEAAGAEEVNGESLQVPEHGEDKDAATKPPRRRRFGWRMLALVVTPVAVMVSKNLNVVRF